MKNANLIETVDSLARTMDSSYESEFLGTFLDLINHSSAHAVLDTLAYIRPARNRSVEFTSAFHSLSDSLAGLRSTQSGRAALLDLPRTSTFISKVDKAATASNVP